MIRMDIIIHDSQIATTATPLFSSLALTLLPSNTTHVKQVIGLFSNQSDLSRGVLQFTFFLFFRTMSDSD